MPLAHNRCRACTPRFPLCCLLERRDNAWFARCLAAHCVRFLSTAKVSTSPNHVAHLPKWLVHRDSPSVRARLASERERAPIIKSLCGSIHVAKRSCWMPPSTISHRHNAVASPTAYHQYQSLGPRWPIWTVCVVAMDCGNGPFYYHFAGSWGGGGRRC